MHEERDTKQKPTVDPEKVVSHYNVNRQMQERSKALSQSIKEKRKEKAVCIF